MAETAFIINPISGFGMAGKLTPVIRKMAFQTGCNVEVLITERAGHASELAADCVLRGVEHVVAVGGDGTVNEVASALVGTECAMSIIPCGSGNGLAHHLGIHTQPIMALQKLFSTVAKGASYRKIDTCIIEGHPFFCTAGVGFDAQVGYDFAHSGHRGIGSYIVNMVKAYRTFTPTVYDLETDGERRQVEAFLITFANASQWGNNAFIAPDASVDDGLIDVMIVSPLRLWSTPRFLLQLLTKRIRHNSHVTIIRCKSARISRPSDGIAHYDGEPVEMARELSVSIRPASLKIIE